MFDLLYEDDHYIAINKPTGILVHRTSMSEDRVFILQVLREQLGYRPYTVHRLDRATSGVLIFGKTAADAGALGRVFMDRSVEKKYLAVVRGYTDEQGTIDYALSDAETGKPLQPAITHYRRLVISELPWAIGNKYSTARFSLVEIEPETGRRQQIRKHFAHIFHPIIGDKRHGDNKHNNYFFEVLEIRRLLLHAHRLNFTHPQTQARVELHAPMDETFGQALRLLQLDAAGPSEP